MDRISLKNTVGDKLAIIIKKIANIDIIDKDISLFCMKYNLSAESMIYIILMAGDEFGFRIHDEFVESLYDYSFNNLVDTIVIQIGN